VLLTDHDTLEAKRRGEERWYDGVLVCVGTEISPEGRDHYLAFGLDEEIDHAGLTPAQIVDAVAEAGGFGFAAHPFSAGSERFERAKGMPWGALDHPGLTWIELWSMVTDTAERLASLRAVAAFVARPGRVLGDPPARNLAEWDRMCLERPVVAIGGVDAHQFGVRVRGRVPIRLMGYHRSFAHLRTHVWLDGPVTGDAAADRDALYAALRAGRCYLAVDSLAPARGFRYAREGDVLVAHVPRPAHLRLVRAGDVVAQAYATELRFTPEAPGPHRVEARLDDRTWILSNPIYVG
jgi:hypothetical protein